jgi:hypothetical protein
MMILHGSQHFLPPKHGPTKSKHIDYHEIGREQHGPGQLSSEIGPASGQTAHEEYRVYDPEIWTVSRKGQEERGHHSDREGYQFQHESSRI